MSRATPGLLLLMLLPASAQDFLQHRLTAAVGALNPAGGRQANTFNAAPLLSFDYGYRFFRYGQADIGVDIGFASESRTDRRRNVYIPRFGYRAIVPFWEDRIEASIGAGAAHSFIKPSIPGYETWLVYGQIGANYAIDAGRRYRAGVTVRWLREPIGRPQQQWVGVGGEFSYSFGR